jgi:2-polyprenyl-6-methoxyphenol hydroxylase-like FAD-dependent oxidoreductase
LLERTGLVPSLEPGGAPIERLHFRLDDEEPMGIDLPSRALTVPQTVFEEALLAALRQRGVAVRAPYQATTVTQNGKHVDVRVLRRELVTLGSPAHYSEWEPVDSSTIRADFVIGADGYDSRMRAAVGIDVVEVAGGESFAMFEFPTVHAPRAAARLGFRGSLGNAMFPLAGGRVRWGCQLDRRLDEAPDSGRLRELLAEYSPEFAAEAERLEWGTVMYFERRLARRFGKDRVWLVGDAAHVTSPLGSQSMNVGLLEAHELVRVIAEIAGGSASLASLSAFGAEREREWHKLLGVNVSFELLDHAPRWLSKYARRIVPALPVSGPDLTPFLERLGIRLG